MIDYRLLLLKYIEHVGQNEGVTFIGEAMDGRPAGWELSPLLFLQEERDELGRLDSCDDGKEISAKYKSARNAAIRASGE